MLLIQHPIITWLMKFTQRCSHLGYNVHKHQYCHRENRKEIRSVVGYNGKQFAGCLNLGSTLPGQSVYGYKAKAPSINGPKTGSSILSFLYVTQYPCELVTEKLLTFTSTREHMTPHARYSLLLYHQNTTGLLGLLSLSLSLSLCLSLSLDIQMKPTYMV